MRFFVFSLPRSRSAWLSMFLTGPHSYCFHEPTAEKDFDRLFATRREMVVGGVDTGAYLNLPLVLSAYPDAKLFTLHRDKSEIVQSSRRLGVNYNAHKAFLPDYEPIYFNQLDSLSYLEDVWGRVIGAGFDAQRAAQLIEMNIQRDVSKFFSARGLVA